MDPHRFSAPQYPGRVDLSPVALRSLYEVAQRGTMTAAAESLGYTPGAVSLHISSLSRAIGQPVVEQAGRRVRLTDAGELLLSHARRMMESEAQLERELHDRSASVAGTVMVGTHGSSVELLCAVGEHLRTVHPDVVLRAREIRETSTENTVLAVSRGEVDLAIDLDYPDAPIPRPAELEYRVLATERFGVAGLAPEEGSGPVCLADLAALEWVIPAEDSAYGRAIRAACRRVGFEPRVRHLVTDTAVSVMLASAGMGITLATPMMMRFTAAQCHWRPLGEEMCRDIVAISRREGGDRPAVAAVLEVLVAVASTRP